jgi:hypothetical protein
MEVEQKACANTSAGAVFAAAGVNSDTLLLCRLSF